MRSGRVVKTCSARTFVRVCAPSFWHEVMKQILFYLTIMTRVKSASITNLHFFFFQSHKWPNQYCLHAFGSPFTCTSKWVRWDVSVCCYIEFNDSEYIRCCRLATSTLRTSISTAVLQECFLIVWLRATVIILPGSPDLTRPGLFFGVFFLNIVFNYN